MTSQALAAINRGANLVVAFKGSGGVAGSSTNVTNVTASIATLVQEPDSFSNGDSSTTSIGLAATKPFANATLTSQIPSSLSQDTSGSTVPITFQSGTPTSTAFIDKSQAVQGTEYFEIIQSNKSAGVLSGAGLDATSPFISVKSGQVGYVLSGTAASVTSALQGLVFTPASGASSLTTPTTFTLYEFNNVGGPGGVPVSAGSVQAITGSISGAYLDGNATQVVTSGGTAYATTLDGYGSGSASGDFIYQGTQIISAGGVASGAIVKAGNVYVSSGGLSVGTVLVSGDKFGINDQSAVANEIVYSGGRASGTSIGPGAVQSISAKGSASGTVVNRGGTQIISAGGTATSTTVAAGGMQNDFGATSHDQISGVQNVAAGGSASFGAIGSGGVQNVAGQSLLMYLGNGGTQNVLSGGDASGTSIIGSLATVSGTLVGNTHQVVSAGGTADNTFAGSGGVQMVLGRANNAIVGSGGVETVGSGGVAAATTIQAGGTATVLSGGTLTDAVISGGTVDLKAGARTSGTLAFSGAGTLEVDAPATSGTLPFVTPIAGYALGDTLDLAGLAYASGTMSGTISGSTLTVGNGKASETFTLQNTSAKGVLLAGDGRGGTLVTVAQAPTIAGGGSITTRGNVRPFGGVSVTDPNSGTTETITIQLSNAGAGGVLVSKDFKGGTNGLYTFSGTAEAATRALGSVEFDPNPVQPNGSATTSFILTDTTTAGTTAVNSGYSVTVRHRPFTSCPTKAVPYLNLTCASRSRPRPKRRPGRTRTAGTRSSVS